MDKPKPLYTFEDIEDEWKKLTEALNTSNFNFSDYLEKKRIIEERNCCSPLRKKADKLISELVNEYYHEFPNRDITFEDWLHHEYKNKIISIYID